MKKAIIAATAVAVVMVGAGPSEARCGVRLGFGFFPVFVPSIALGWSETRYVAPPPPERVVIRADDGCKKIVKKIYDEDGVLIDKQVYRDCRDRDDD